ncbi:MFS general substrate transporter [Bimuria novae-zelandiae CBS 107.79]|uniref:MFS general substrate transporter n=1 Tax=Bimuria novae-zelandiae CBS 107.79 TaxID=1447943 RepID=A0A6A5V771_9PLEO|nr:MFS general substrate transporter [Bimuria novae-zelandiae CBS 107.79]
MQQPTQVPAAVVTQDLEKNVAIEQTVNRQVTCANNAPIKLEPHELPTSWPALKKWSATLVIVLMTASITFASSIHTAGISAVSQSFGVSKTVATLPVTTFLLGFATGPLLFAPLSEVLGRTLIFRVVLGLFCCFNLGCALAPNVEALLVLRFLCGFFGAPTVTNSGGSLADIWPQSQRSVPFALFTTGSSLGPVVAPIVGGFVAENLSWRWHYWIMTIFSGVVYVAMLFLLPETYATVLLQWKKKQAGIEPVKMSFKERYANDLTRPWTMLFTEPILFTLGLYSAFIWGILYLDFTAYPVVFQQGRQWSQGKAGLSFIGIGIGMAVATASSPWINNLHGAIVKKIGPKPEARLPHLIVLAWFIPVALFWFGWTASPGIHPLVPIAAGVPFGIGFVTLFLGTNAYLSDCYGRFSASAWAANAVLRSLFSAGFPLFASQMYVRMGIPWANSTLGIIAVVMAPVPWVLWKWGGWLRARSRFHLWTMDLEKGEEG